MALEINKPSKTKFIAVMDETGKNVSDIIENTKDQVTTSGRDIMIVADSLEDLKQAVYDGYIEPTDEEPNPKQKAKKISDIEKDSKVQVKKKPKEGQAVSNGSKKLR